MQNLRKIASRKEGCKWTCVGALFQDEGEGRREGENVGRTGIVCNGARRASVAWSEMSDAGLQVLQPALSPCPAGSVKLCSCYPRVGAGAGAGWRRESHCCSSREGKLAHSYSGVRASSKQNRVGEGRREWRPPGGEVTTVGPRQLPAVKTGTELFPRKRYSSCVTEALR